MKAIQRAYASSELRVRKLEGALGQADSDYSALAKEVSQLRAQLEEFQVSTPFSF